MATRMGTLSYGRQFLLFRSPASRAEGHWFARYAHAVMCVAAATVLRACLGRMGVSPPYITYFPAVALAAWVNGMGPGIVATILAALCSDFFFIQPVMKLGISSAGEYLAHVVFIAMSLAISALAAWSRITDGALQQRTRELDEAQLVAGLGSWTLDAASGAVTWSRGLYRLAGREPGGGAPVLPYCLCTEESRERMRQAVEQCMGTGWPYELEA